jgi:predicted RNA methylase
VTALNSLQLQWEDFAFIDLGSGKGRTLLLAAEYPFERVIGVEYCPQLNEVARSNIPKLRLEIRRCRSIEVVTIERNRLRIP